MSDLELIAALKESVRRERASRVDVLRLLLEFDKRRLNAPQGMPSLFHYCTRTLGYSEDAAFKRIRAVRTIEKFSIVLRWLKKGRVHLGAVVALGPRMTPENHRELLSNAMGKSIRELEFMSASLDPKPDKADHVRVLSPIESRLIAAGPPAPIDAGAEKAAVPDPPALVQSAFAVPPRAVAAPPRDSMDALSGERLRIAFTASRELWEMLSRARELLRGRHPDGRFEELFHEALAALLREIDPLVREPAKRRESNVGGDRARHIPKAVRDEVWRRDQGRCTFVSPGGDRCPASGRLELDHIVPWALGGRPDAGNLRLRCRAHNLLSARRAFGARAFV